MQSASLLYTIRDPIVLLATGPGLALRSWQTGMPRRKCRPPTCSRHLGIGSRRRKFSCACSHTRPHSSRCPFPSPRLKSAAPRPVLPSAYQGSLMTGVCFKRVFCLLLLTSGFSFAVVSAPYGLPIAGFPLPLRRAPHSDSRLPCPLGRRRRRKRSERRWRRLKAALWTKVFKELACWADRNIGAAAAGFFKRRLPSRGEAVLLRSFTLRVGHLF